MINPDLEKLISEGWTLHATVTEQHANVYLSHRYMEQVSTYKKSLYEAIDDVVLRARTFPTKKRPPDGCHMCNEDIECLGCGEKLRLIAPGKCAAVDPDWRIV